MEGVQILVALLAPAPGATAAPACMRVEAPLASGEVPLRAQVVPHDCPADGADAAFRYDPAAGTVRALRDIPGGAVVRAVPLSLLAAVKPGQKLVLVEQVGTATVAREVTALRAARAGERVLVRGAAGAAFTAPGTQVQP
ncbi:MAG TPA: hypothetical protein VKI45_03725 [Allosphingosinicella sp.]|nr:hypothetical protein [Allosphingosinicella sp.]